MAALDVQVIHYFHHFLTDGIEGVARKLGALQVLLGLAMTAKIDEQEIEVGSKCP